MCHRCGLGLTRPFLPPPPPPARRTDDKDLEHPDYINFHFNMYALTDSCIGQLLHSDPSVTHLLVTNGDNVHSLEFLAKTCRAARGFTTGLGTEGETRTPPADLVGVGQSSNGWNFGCAFHPQLRLLYADLGSVLISARIFRKAEPAVDGLMGKARGLGRRFTTSLPSNFTRQQEWFRKGVMQERWHPGWRARLGNRRELGATWMKINWWSQNLDGLFFEDVLSTTDATAVVIPELLFIHK